VFPRAPEDVTAAWLDRVLHDSGALPAGRLAGFESAVVGTGQMGTSVRYALSYDGDAAGAPRLWMPVRRGRGSWWRSA
jgi:hypothetical protein